MRNDSAMPLRGLLERLPWLAAVSLVAISGVTHADPSPAPEMPGRVLPCEAEPPEVEKAVWTSYYADTQVWGYVDRHSVTPGESFDLMLSTKPGGAAALQVRAEVFRIGHDPAGERTLVWRSEPVGVDCQP